MEVLIILSVLFVVGVFIAKKSYYYESLGMLISVFSAVCILIHILYCSLASYKYHKFIIEREAFIETLEYARKNQSQFELASITREVSKWNQRLGSLKYDNTIFLLKDYIDDRVMILEPIK